MSPAAFQVFNTAELAEMILGHLQPRDLLHRVKLVCRRFYRLVRFSSFLRKTLTSHMFIDIAGRVFQDPGLTGGLTPRDMHTARATERDRQIFVCYWRPRLSSSYFFSELRCHKIFRRLRIGLGAPHGLKLSWKVFERREISTSTTTTLECTLLVEKCITLGRIFDVVAGRTPAGRVESIVMKFGVPKRRSHE